MKLVVGHILTFLAVACIYAFQPMLGTELQHIGADSESYQFVESLNHSQGVAPNQSQLTVRMCQLNQKLVFNGFYEVVKSSSKVFFNSYSHNKVNRVGFLIKFCKVDIPFPFSSFW